MGGGPGVRVHQFGGARPRRRPRDPNAPPEPPASAQSTLLGLLPLLIILVLPLLSSLFSGATTPSGPSMRFDSAQPPHTMHRTTPQLKVNYYINPAEVQEYNGAKFKVLDLRAENNFMQDLRLKCEAENQARARLQEEAQGWFFPDMEKLARASKMEMKSCVKWDEYQRIRRGW